MDAIYVDFECLQKPAIPAILGVLIERRGQTSFEQIVLDDRLAPAAVARPQLGLATLAETVARLTDSGLPIVGWSFFDRDLVTAQPIDASLTSRWRAHYVNGLAVAKPWRTKVHPTFVVQKASKFDPKNTLDKYAELAGYPDVAQLRNKTPAKYIRHVLEQLESRHYYRRITKQAKRDWHTLLKYNRHDCQALRHVHLKATFELQKWREYEKTNYCIEATPRRPICFRAGSTNARLDALLQHQGAQRWAFLTAWNPASEQLSRTENNRRQTALIEGLTAAGYRCLPGESCGKNPAGPAEESVLALDIPSRVARRFGRRFGQLAIVVGDRGSRPRLIACE
jgi:Protein of unknown function (DUF3293)